MSSSHNSSNSQHSSLKKPNKSVEEPNPLEPTQDLSPHSKFQLFYDLFMLFIIIIDLLIMGTDMVLTSQFAAQIATWLGFEDVIIYYSENIHTTLRILGGGFTIFLIVEMLLRWLIAIATKKYIRWFFFPFIHWYEVLGCFPQLRALRLLRAVVIGHKLYKLGYQVLPQSWIDSGKFYYDLVLEELTDRVILTATDTLRKQLSGEESGQHLIYQTVNKNRSAIHAMITSIFEKEIAPKLDQFSKSVVIHEISQQVGVAVQDALENTPELRRYLRMIPIGGKLIENELQAIGQQIGKNLVMALSTRLTQTETTELILTNVVQAISNVNIDNPELEALIFSIVNDALVAFEDQVRVQQWKHHDYLAQIID